MLPVGSQFDRNGDLRSGAVFSQASLRRSKVRVTSSAAQATVYVDLAQEREPSAVSRSGVSSAVYAGKMLGVVHVWHYRSPALRRIAELWHIIKLMQEYPIGPNRNYVDGSLVYTVLEGFTDVHHAKEYLALVEQVHRQHGQVFTIINNEKKQTMDPGARRQFYEFAQRNLITASATIGGGPIYRTMLTLMIRALHIVNSKICPYGFFATDEEASAWIQEQRKLYPARPRL